MDNEHLFVALEELFKAFRCINEGLFATARLWFFYSELDAEHGICK